MSLIEDIQNAQVQAGEQAVINNLKKLGFSDTAKPKYPWPDPKPKDLSSKDFNLVWECIKTWDINVPEVYAGYSGATGNHVMSILFATGKRNIQDYIL